MAKWTDYTTDTNPTDTDEVMTLDADKTPKANNRVTLSTLADYFLDKLASKVFEKLETQNKTILGAINELNSKHEMIPDYSKPSLISISTEEGSISFTAPSNGYIIGSGFGDGQAKNFLYLHCGDVSIRQQGNSNENIGSIFPVKKGDVVGISFYFSEKNNGIYFVPTV